MKWYKGSILCSIVRRRCLVFSVDSRMFQGKVVHISRTFDLGYKMEGFGTRRRYTSLKIILVWKDNQ